MKFRVCLIYDFLVTDFINLYIILMIRFVYFDENVELRQIQVCERILVLCSSDVLLYDEITKKV